MDSRRFDGRALTHRYTLSPSFLSAVRGRYRLNGMKAAKGPRLINGRRLAHTGRFFELIYLSVPSRWHHLYGNHIKNYYISHNISLSWPADIFSPIRGQKGIFPSRTGPHPTTEPSPGYQCPKSSPFISVQAPARQNPILSLGDVISLSIDGKLFPNINEPLPIQGRRRNEPLISVQTSDRHYPFLLGLKSMPRPTAEEKSIQIGINKSESLPSIGPRTAEVDAQVDAHDVKSRVAGQLMLSKQENPPRLKISFGQIQRKTKDIENRPLPAFDHQFLFPPARHNPFLLGPKTMPRPAAEDEPIRTGINKSEMLPSIGPRTAQVDAHDVKSRVAGQLMLSEQENPALNSTAEPTERYERESTADHIAENELWPRLRVPIGQIQRRIKYIKNRSFLDFDRQPLSAAIGDQVIASRIKSWRSLNLISTINMQRHRIGSVPSEEAGPAISTELKSSHSDPNPASLGSTQQFLTPVYRTVPSREAFTPTGEEISITSSHRLPSTAGPMPFVPSAQDLNRISEQVCSIIERKLLIERERRGIYG